MYYIIRQVPASFQKAAERGERERERDREREREREREGVVERERYR